MIQNLPLDLLVIGLVVTWTFMLLMILGGVAWFLVNRSNRKFRYPLTPLEEAMRGLTRMVEEADWLEGEKLILAVRHVALAKEAVERAAKYCGKSALGIFHAPSPLVRALDDGIEILGGSAAVLTFACPDCGQEMTAMIQFPKAGGRPESTDPITISAPADWREIGFTASAGCKRCQKLLMKKLLYDSLPV